MPSIELLAEVESLKKQIAETEEAARMYCQRTLDAEARAKRAERMAGLWKQLAKRWHVSGWTGAEYNVLLYREQCKLKREAEAERDALKCCGNCDRYAEDCESYKCDHPGPYEALIKTSSCPSPWHVCPEWKAREK
jgi:hypothetical protein